MKIPVNNQWVQTNRSNIFGSLWSSKNLDLNILLGEISISPRMLLNVSSSDLANLGVPCAFKWFLTNAGIVWAIAGSYMFSSPAGANTAFVQDATLNTPTNLNSNTSDMEVFGSSLYVSSSSTSLYKLSNAGVWSALAGRVNNSSGLHMFAYFRFTNRLYFIDDNSNSVGSIDTGDTAATMGNQYTLQNIVGGGGTNVGLVLSWIKATSTSIWVGTYNQSGKGQIIQWNGDTANTPSNIYSLDTNGTLAGVVKDDVIYALDVEGKLLAFNGGTFVEVARFPVDKKIFGQYQAGATARPVHHNGMTIVDGEINILVNSAVYDTGFPASISLEKFASGIWEYKKDIGLYHKNSIGLTKSDGTISDFGQSKLSLVGALAQVKVPVPSSIATIGTQNGTYLCGVKYYTDATTQLFGIFYEDTANTLRKSGYFVTSKIYSSQIQDNYEQVFPRFKKFTSASDYLYVKYRTDEDTPTEATISWAGANLFATTTDVSAYVVGDEVEILQGPGAGMTGTITQIIHSGSAWYVDLDTSITGLSGTAIARFQTWRNAGIFNNTTADFSKASIVTKGTFFWIKIVINVVGSWSLFDLDLAKSTHQLAK